MRKLTGLAAAGLLAITIATPVSAKDFGTIYVDGHAYRTFGNPATVPPGTGTDPIFAFTNFDQGGVAQFAPRQVSDRPPILAAMNRPDADWHRPVRKPAVILH